MSIAALIEAVEAGHTGMALVRSIPDGTSFDHERLIYSAATGSLDAAMALHEALLPGWMYDVSRLSVVVSHWPDNPDDATYFCASREDSDAGGPARAWLLAILRAKEAGQ